jgi:hypothetical protein
MSPSSSALSSVAKELGNAVGPSSRNRYSRALTNIFGPLLAKDVCFEFGQSEQLDYHSFLERAKIRAVYKLQVVV